MSRKYANYGGFTERCKEFYRHKGKNQPRCGCNTCWADYFFYNPGKTAAAALALRRFGPNPIITVQGAEWAMEIALRENLEMKAGRRKALSNYYEIRRARGKRYLKHLVYWLQSHPMSEAEAEGAAELSPYEQQAVQEQAVTA
jgi:hypothetical protein